MNGRNDDAVRCQVVNDGYEVRLCPRGTHLCERWRVDPSPDTHAAYYSHLDECSGVIIENLVEIAPGVWRERSVP